MIKMNEQGREAMSMIFVNHMPNFKYYSFSLQLQLSYVPYFLEHLRSFALV
jgi:hypothetical protein